MRGWKEPQHDSWFNKFKLSRESQKPTPGREAQLRRGLLEAQFKNSTTFSTKTSGQDIPWVEESDTEAPLPPDTPPQSRIRKYLEGVGEEEAAEEEEEVAEEEEEEKEEEEKEEGEEDEEESCALAAAS